MYRTILKAALAAMCGVMPLLAQPAHLAPGNRPAGRGPARLGPPTGAVFDASRMGSPLLLDRNWRVGITADPRAAEPEFDDSSWATRNAQAEMDEIPDEEPDPAAASAKSSNDTTAATSHERRYVWFRLRIKLAPQHGPLALLIELPVSRNTSVELGSGDPALSVFVNGRAVEPEGPNGSAPQHYQQISRIYDLQVPLAEDTITLAVRTLYVPVGYGAYTNFFANHSLRLGHRRDLARELRLWSNRNLFERLPRLVYSILLIVLAAFLLALYFAQKGHIEYLWLALHELMQAPIAFVDLAGSSAWLDSLWYAALMLQLLLVSAYLFFEFLVAFLALPRRWYIRWLRYTAPILAGVGPVLLLVGHSTAVGVTLAFILLGSTLWMLGWSLFIFITLIAATLRRNFEAGLLLIPLVLGLVGIIEPVAVTSLSDLSGHAYQSPLTVMAGPIPIHFSSIGDFTGILVIILIIFGRFLRIHRDRERASNELAAARSVQELMIPREKPATPGFEVDSVYNPANEVGGDFFHVQMVETDGMLVVIGDVAGKGLKAAMNVSMLMGALRRTTERSPARILESLNRVLAGSESFTTCQAAWFGSNGEMVVANAGHLPPYLNSQEVALPGGLPLGVLAETTYEEIRLYLHPGDRILLVSDGVVEARGPSGELFGFDRVHNLSNQSAFYIADAARAFGQEDDITVLTVKRLAA